MAPNSFGRLLFELETSRYSFGRSQAARVAKLLRRLETARFPDPSSLVRFHEALMFLRAFPKSEAAPPLRTLQGWEHFKEFLCDPCVLCGLSFSADT